MSKLILLFFVLVFSINTYACSYTIIMHDSSGDGWDGGSTYEIYINGSSDGTTYYLPSGSTGTGTIDFNEGENVEIYFNAGTYASECSWQIFDFNGDLVCSGDGSSYSNPICSWNQAVCPTCSDGIQNGLEEGIDCGGPCAICPTTACSGGFYDTGGPGSDYQNDENGEWLFCSADGQDLYMTFYSFATEAGYDYLYVYDGSDDTAPLIGQYDGTTLNGQTIISNNASNCLYFVFTSDVGTTGSGWEASYACGTYPPPPPPPAPTEEDCLGAIPLCQDSYHNSSGSYGTGMYGNEINVGESECLVQELGGNWYTFTPETSGILNFTITPDNPSGEDYDWALFDLTNANCEDLATGDPYNYMMSANAAGNDGSWPEVNWGPTGISSANAVSGSGNCNGPGTGAFNTFNPDVTINAGGTYVLYIAQFDGSNGYTVDFGDSQADLYDVTPPEITSIQSPIVCGATSITFYLSENIDCSSVDDGEFYLTGPGGPYTLSNITSPLCSGGADYDNYLTATVSPAITTSGTFTIGLDASISGSIYDMCGNTASSIAFDFDVNSIVTTSSFTDVTCNGGNDGSAFISITSGGTAPYTYEWSTQTTDGPNNNTSSTESNLSAGAYSVTLTDNVGCQAVEDYTISEPNAIVPTLSSSPANCGGADGSISISLTNATAPIDYTWFATSGGGTTNGNISDQANPYTISNLEASVYEVDITDANGCTATGSVEVENTGTVTADFSISNDQCLEGNSFDFTDNSGMTSGVTYDIISPSLISSSVNGTPDYVGFVANEVGTWTVTQNISSGSCNDSQTLTFEVFEEPVLSETHSDATCNGLADGQIIANSTLSGTYTMISGSGSFVGTTASNLAAGNYSFIITTANACDDTLDVTISEPQTIVLNATATDLSCGGTCDGSVTVNITSGGVGPFSYDWGAIGLGQSISDLCSGSYSVTVYDGNTPANGCSATASVTVNTPVVETYSNTTVSSNCGQSDGAATINVTTNPSSSSYSYTWFDANYTQLSQSLNSTSISNTLSNISAGVYYVEVVNAGGCTDTTTITVSDAGAPTIAITDSQNISCNGGNDGSIAISLGGTLVPNFTYQWNRNSVSYSTTASTSATTDQQSSLPSGDYEIIVTDNNGCQASTTITLVEPSVMQGTISSLDAICATPGSATVNVIGGTTPYQYTWNDANNQTNATATGLVAGDYTCDITDDNGCSISLSTTIINDSYFDNQIQVDHTISCYEGSDGQISVTPIGGTAPYSYEWSDDIGNVSSNSVHSNLPEGTYNVTISDVNGCTAQNSISLTSPTELQIQAFTDPASCYAYEDAKAWVVASEGTAPYNYLWSNGVMSDYNINILSNYYNVSVTDANGCSKSIYGIEVQQPNQVVLALEYEPSICIGQSAEIRMSVTSSPFSPYTYYWNGIQTSDVMTVSPVVTTTYSAQAKDAHGCESPVRDVTVTVNPPISLQANADRNVICKGDVVNISVEANGGNGNYSYRFVDGTQLTEPITVNPEYSQDYYIIASDDCGSPEDTVIIPIEVKEVVVPSYHANVKSGCMPLEVNFIQDVSHHEEGTSYFWNFGDESSSNISFDSSPIHIYNNSGAFHVSLEITTPFGCKSQSIEYNYINVFPLPTASFVSNPPVSSIIKPVIYFNNTSTGADVALWSFGDGDSSSTWSPEHKYRNIPEDYLVSLIAINRYSCKDTISQKVYIKDEVTLFVPSGFTPDGDGKNELFIAKGNGIVEDGFEMIIYDRWGEEIFSSSKISEGWDGKVKGGDYGKPGIYPYTIKFVDIYGVPHERAGTVNLIR